MVGKGKGKGNSKGAKVARTRARARKVARTRSARAKRRAKVTRRYNQRTLKGTAVHVRSGVTSRKTAGNEERVSRRIR